MKTLIWKEWRENLKWIAIPGILLLGSMGFLSVPMLLEEQYLATAYWLGSVRRALWAGGCPVDGDTAGLACPDRLPRVPRTARGYARAM